MVESEAIGPSADAGHRTRALLLVVALAGVAWLYRDTYASIFQKWTSDAAFSHGFLVLPISLWLVWRRRSALSRITLSPSWFGVAAVFACTAAWMVARGSGVLVIEQFAAVALIPSVILTLLGWPATRVLVFPLAFLFFAVPFGRALVPWLMQVTADIATLALGWSGVPVLRTHMFISIPDGNFEVARACSGLNYFVTGLVLGVLYAHITYRGWLKRFLCVLAFIVVPILLNGLRVYVTILVAHLTEMRFGPGVEHVTFGRVFFVVVMLGMFWVGRRWQDDAPLIEASAASGPVVGFQPRFAWLPVAASVAIAFLGPALLSASIERNRSGLASSGKLIRLPASAGEWQGPQDGRQRWRPLYQGGIVEQQGYYTDSSGAELDVFVAVYGLGNSLGSEMISFGNVVVEDEHQSLLADQRRRVSLPDGSSMEVRELVVSENGHKRLVWQWFMVGERAAAGSFTAKALEAIAFISFRAVSERVVALSTAADGDGVDRLRSFVLTYPGCVTAGFAHEACAR